MLRAARLGPLLARAARPALARAAPAARVHPDRNPNDPDAKMLMQQRNGEVMLDGGWISLQGESHPVEFRRVEVKPLPAGKADAGR